MTILVLGFFTVLAPLALILWLALSSNRDRFEWTLKLLLVGNITFLFFQIGPWAITSYYLRYVVIACFLLGAIYSYLKNWRGLSARTGPVRAVWGKIAWATAFIGLNAVSIIGQLPPKTSVSLRFPLTDGRYYLLQGGTTWVTNLFHSLIPEGKYALDVVQLNDLGNRAKNLFPPHRLTEYHIYGADLYSPCTGTVKQAVGSLTDNVPPTVDWDCHGVNVALLHMQAGSLKLSKGDAVTTGQPIGKVGNSGYSDEPHLHIQANTEDGRPIPIEFNGEFLATNDVYNN